MKTTAIKTKTLACAAALTLALSASNTAYAAEPAGGPVDLTYAAEKAVPAVVHIKFVQNSRLTTVDVEDPFEFFDPFGFFGNPRSGRRQQQVETPKREASGSGVIISADGYIVTNNHVVEGADELTVTLNDNREFSARVIGTDKNTDLALIKIEAKNLPAITIGDSEKLKIGEWVIAVGNPFNLNSTVTAGIVSAKARSLYANGVESFIQTDAAINQGNSGGALVNVQGELVGINAMLYSQTGSYSGYGFAIPTTIMNKVVADLKKYGTVQRAVLAIEGMDVHRYIDQQKAKGNEVDLDTNEGVYVTNVADGGAGYEAGLEKGDVIVAVDGKKVTKMAELQEIMASKRPGEKVKLTFIHKGNKKEKVITLKNEQGTTEVVKSADLDLLGANFREVTKEQKESLGISYGLEIIKIGKGKLQEEGLSKGFIIQKVNDDPVKTIDDLQKIVKEVSMSKDPVLFIQGIYPTGKRKYFAVPLKD